MRITRRRLRTNLLFSLLAVSLGFGLCEGVLRVFAAGTGTHGYYQITLPDGIRFGEVLYPAVSDRGFRRETVSPPAVAAIVIPGAAGGRLVLLGESTTEAFPLPLLAAAALQQRGLAAVTNYGREATTSDYGTSILAEILAARPVMVFISFVWNDHWLARRRAAAPATGAAAARAFVGRHLRGFNLMEYWYCRRGYDTAELRVPAARYVANYEQMIRDCRAAGAEVVVWTAPTTLTALDPPPADYRREGHLPAASSVAGIHRRYNDLARSAAASGGATVLDIAAAFAAEPPARQNDLLYDTIHFTATGYEWLADRFSRYLAAGDPSASVVNGYGGSARDTERSPTR